MYSNSRKFLVCVVNLIGTIALLSCGFAFSTGLVQAHNAVGSDNQSLRAGLESAIQAVLEPAPQGIRPRSGSQQAELTSGDGGIGDYFGYSVALSGDSALVGAPNKGAAYVFIRSGTAWSLQQKLTASDGVASDKFGNSAALSGDTALVGAYNRNNGAGAVYVFTRTGTTWTEQSKLTASDASEGVYFGNSVALSGDTALVGADGGQFGYLYNSTGAAYVFTRSGTAWTQQQKLTASDAVAGDQFGISVALSGDTALIGAFHKNNYVGAAYTFIRSGTTWSQQAALVLSDGITYDYFGYAVALSGDTALIGAYGRNGTVGAAYIFTRNGTMWSQQAELTDSGSPSSYFGYAVALSGDTALIGSIRNNAAYIFTGSGGIWTEQQKLTANGGAGNDGAGNAVALSNNTALVGASSKNTTTGAAYVFVGAVTRPDTIGVYKAGVWYLRNSNTSGPADITVLFGGDASDLPVVGDWNGDGVDTIGVYRSSIGVMFLSNGNTSPNVVYNPVFGNPGDTPFAGRWDNTMNHDGIGVYRPSNGILYEKKNLTTGFSDYFAIFGNPGDQGVAGDWNGDGIDGIGVYRPSLRNWYLTNNGGPSGITYSDINFVWTIGNNLAVVGDWAGSAWGGTTVGYLTTTGNFVLHATNAAAGFDTIFSFGPTGARPVAGKWTATVAPPAPPNVLVKPPLYNPPTPSGFE